MFSFLMIMEALHINHIFINLMSLSQIFHFISCFLLDGGELLLISNKKERLTRLIKTAEISYNNLMFVFPIIAYLFSLIMDGRMEGEEYFGYTVLRFIFYFSVFDLWFEITHRLLHSSSHPYLKEIHQIHHKETYSFALSGVCMHPLEFAFVLCFGMLLGPMLVPPKNDSDLYLYINLCIFFNAYIHSKLGNHIHLKHHLYPNTEPSALGFFTIYFDNDNNNKIKNK